MRRWLWVFLAVSLFLSLGAVQAEKRYGAERFDVTAEVLAGGDMHVHENVVFDFQGGPFTFVFRDLPTQATDGIVDIVASVDGRALPPGDGPGQVEIAYGNPIRVTWHMEPTSNAAREFGLEYRMLGVVRQEQNSDLLWWRPLPVEHEYAIGSSRTVVSYPPEWPLASQPSIEQGQAMVSGESGQIVFSAGALGPNESLTVSIPFQSASVLSGPPAWQAQQEAAARQEALRKAQQDDRAWIWFALSALAVGGGIALLFPAVAPYRRRVEEIKGLAYEPPTDLAPAIAGVLRSSWAAVTWEQALGALFELAGRGYVTIEQLPKRRWSGHDFLIRRLDGGNTGREDGLRPHEAALMSLLLVDKKGLQQQSVKVSKLNNLVSSKRWKRFEKRMEAEMIAAGLLDERRKNARGRIMALALIPMLLIVVVLAVMLIFLNAFGLWPLVLAGALVIVIIAWLVGGGSISALSDSGALQAAEWEPFYRYLKQVSKGKSAPANEDEFELYLPYATAYGLLRAWAKRFEKRGWTETPAYFRPLHDAGQRPMAAFVAMTAATSSSGGSASTSAAGAAGAGGAAGGGASGAG